jgi:hypothetical protein
MRADIASQQRQERAEAWPSSRKKRAGRQAERRRWCERNEKKEKKQRGRKKWEEKKFLFRLDEKFNLGSSYIAVTYLLTYGVFLDLFKGWLASLRRKALHLHARPGLWEVTRQAFAALPAGGFLVTHVECRRSRKEGGGEEGNRARVY